MEHAPLDPAQVCFCYWTRWPYRYERVQSDASLREVAKMVVEACWEFARRTAGGNPALLCFLKTAGRGAGSLDSFRAEESIFQSALSELEQRNAGSGTRFEYHYLPIQPVVCVPWEIVWKASRWWERGSILAFPTMDFIDAMLPARYQITSLASVPTDVRAALRQTSERFRQLLARTAETKGLTVGGYRTCETYPDIAGGALVDESNRARRGGLAAKDMIEAAFRCYASGTLAGFSPLGDLLQTHPDFRLRSEILAVGRECWQKLFESKRLAMEPFEATFQLVIGALLEGCAVDQVDFGWLIEEGNKPDSTVAEQIKRGIHTIDRLRHFWFAGIQPAG